MADSGVAIATTSTILQRKPTTPLASSTEIYLPPSCQKKLVGYYMVHATGGLPVAFVLLIATGGPLE